MSILSDIEIKELAQNDGMISPFVRAKIIERNGKRVISYGLSSCGYDIRVAEDFQQFNPYYGQIIDVKSMQETDGLMITLPVYEDGSVTLPPNSIVLCKSVEYFSMPNDVIATCVGKSTYARLGLIVNVTPLEPGWFGELTLEITNTNPNPVTVYANEGIAQLMFCKPDIAPDSIYTGKYNGQQGVTHAKL